MIFTFYSYKGGVGRSMTLSNVAELFLASGLDVLLVDWDLEAPGIERYFPASVDRVLECRGVIDLLVNYKAKLANPPSDVSRPQQPLPLPELDDYLVDLYPDRGGPGRLRLLPAGQRNDENFERYGALVRSFDWLEFYRDWEGELFFEWLRGRLADLADVVLVDSRTGISEMGGVCTYQLADAVVMFCGGNEQNLDGTRRMAERFKAPDVVELRHDRPLPVLVVPARIEDRAEKELFSQFEEQFRSSFGLGRFGGDAALAAPVEELWRLRIPHVPYYAFREDLVVHREGGGVHADLYEAMLRLRARLALMAPESSTVRVATRRARAAELPAPQQVPAIANTPPLSAKIVGRGEELVLIEELLSEGLATPGPAVVGLVGLGGIGKRTLAAAYADRHGSDYALIWWLRADDEASVVQGFAAVAGALGIPPQRDDAAAEGRRWLEAHERWLLVFADLEDPALLQRWLPNGPGHVLFTSRRSGGWGDLARVVAVEPIAHDDAVALLLARTGSSDRVAAADLASELGGLPLALEAAAAYAADTGISLAAYLERFRGHAAGLLDRGPYNVRRAFELSLGGLESAEPAAVDLLALLAFVAPEDLPRNVLVEHASILPDDLERVVSDALALDEAVAALLRYSLVRVIGASFSVHRLVQTVVRDRLGADEERRWAGAAARLLQAGFPADGQDPSTWAVCAQLLPHALAAGGHAERLAVETEAATWLFDRAATYLQGRGRFPEAKGLFERALALGSTTLGETNPAVAAARNNLGSVLLDLGDFPSAEAAFRQALEAHEATAGDAQPEVLGIRNNLALALQERGDLPDARAQLDEAVRAAERAFGPDHPAAAAVLANLGSVLLDLGDLAGARARFERALAIDEAALGPDHAAVARVRNNLGVVFLRQGDPATARMQFERALAIDEAALGPDHPTIAARCSNLGSALEALGDLRGAVEQFERALAIDQAALGSDHPDTVRTQEKLTRIERATGLPAQRSAF